VTSVEIHWVHRGNKWMGSSDFDDMNKVTSQTAGRGLKSKHDNKVGTDYDNKHDETNEH